MDNVSMGLMQGGERRPYACQVCNKRFTQKAHLITHKRTHTGEKPYACHICHKRFAQSSHLNTHKRIHTGEKPYYCTLCNVGYVRKQRLEVHLLQHSREALIAANIPVPDEMEAQHQENAAMNLVDFQESGGIVFPTNVSGIHTGNLPDTNMSLSNSSVPDTNMPLNPDMQSALDEAMSGFLSHSRRKPSIVNRINFNDQESGDQIVHERRDINEDCVTSATGMKTEPNFFLNEAADTSGDFNTSSITEGNMDSSFEKGLCSSAEKGVEPGRLEAVSDGNGQCGVSTTDMNNSGSADEADGASVTSESNLSGSEQSVPTSLRKRSMLSYVPMGSRSNKGAKRLRHGHVSGTRGLLQPDATCVSDSAQIGTNSRICLVNFTSEDLITHLMSRDDVYRCDFCCVIFQDAAMYHLHRSMHEKMDIRCCNLCGKLAQDKYDFLAHFLSEHK